MQFSKLLKDYFLLSAVGINILLFFYFLLTQQYHKPLVVIHIFSLIFIWFWVFRPIKIWKYSFGRGRLIGILLILFFIALAVRLYNLEVITPGINGDEITVGIYSIKQMADPQFTPFVGDYSHATPLLYLTGIAFEWFGKSLLTLRWTSIFFGALTVPVFYLLLRQYVSPIISILGAILMITSYPQITISRLAYEPAPALFFFTLALLFLSKFFKSKNIHYLVGLGFAIGGGLYTYLSFRTTALFLLLLIFLLLKNLFKLNETLKYFLVVLVSIFITTVPLTAYSIMHQDQIWARAKDISVFNEKYHLPPGEILKEIGGSTARALGQFGFVADMIPGYAPARVPMYDLLTVGLMLLGLLIAFRKNRKIFVAGIVLVLSFLVNDSFSVEFAPDIPHYYGQGHPNTLRAAGTIAIVFFLVAYALDRLKPVLAGVGKGFYLTIVVSLAFIIASLNMYYYFGQKNLSPEFYVYNFKYNAASDMDIYRYISKTKTSRVLLTSKYFNSPSVRLFLSDRVEFVEFNPKSSEDAMQAIKQSPLTIVDSTINPDIVAQIGDEIQKEPFLYRFEELMGPFGVPYAIAITTL